MSVQFVVKWFLCINLFFGVVYSFCFLFDLPFFYTTGPCALNFVLLYFMMDQPNKSKVKENAEKNDYKAQYLKVIGKQRDLKPTDERSMKEKWNFYRKWLYKFSEENLIGIDFLKNDLEKFFWCHELTVAEFGPIMAYYMSVHYNLFLGTVVHLGTEKHLKICKNMGDNVGCFCFTEMHAGVYSGSVVDTTATWTGKGFSLHSNDPKNWISLGEQAQLGVVMANLIFKGENKGPHFFFVDFSKITHVQSLDDRTPNTVYRGPVKEKNVLIGLDNAVLQFNEIQLPYDSLLDKYVSIEAEEYKAVGGKFSFMKVLSRLISGRLCIASAAWAAVNSIFDEAKEYCENKTIHLYYDKHTKTTVTAQMNSLGHIKKLFNQFDAENIIVQNYICWVQKYFAKHYENPDEILLNSIFMAKSYCTERAIDLTNEIKKDLGTMAFYTENRIDGLQEALYTLVVVEGDNKLLKQQIVKGLLSKAQKKPLKLLKTFFTKANSDYIGHLLHLLMHVLTSSSNKTKAFMNNLDKVFPVATSFSRFEMYELYVKEHGYDTHAENYRNFMEF